MLIVTQWCHMTTRIWVNIGSDNGMLPDCTKPLPKSMLPYLHSDLFRVIWIKMQNFLFRKIPLKILSTYQRPFCPGCNDLMASFLLPVQPIANLSYIIILTYPVYNIIFFFFCQVFTLQEATQAQENLLPGEVAGRRDLRPLPRVRGPPPAWQPRWMPPRTLSTIPEDQQRSLDKSLEQVWDRPFSARMFFGCVVCLPVQMEVFRRFLFV